MKLTKHQYLAAHIRDALTEAKIDLLLGSKRQIEKLIEKTLNEREKQWPAFDREQSQRLVVGL